MPNHVSIIVTVAGKYSELHTFINKHLIETDEDAPDGAMQFDFNTITQMPEELSGEHTQSPVRTDTDEQKEQNAALLAKYGFDNWYDWSIQNWGTKWNSYDCDCHNIIMEESARAEDKDQSISFSFMTAWDLPRPIFDKLAEMYPTLAFHIECCEEGGFFAGETDIINGEVIDKIVHNNEEHWKHWAGEILGYQYDEVGDII